MGDQLRHRHAVLTYGQHGAILAGMWFVTLIDRVNGAVGRAAAWLGLLMVLVGAWSAVGGQLEGWVGRRLSFVWLDEAQWYLFSLLFLFAAPWALREEAHVRVDVLYGRLGPRSKGWIDLLGGATLLLPFCLYAVWVTVPAGLESWRVREDSPDAGGLLRWPLRLAVPVAFALLSLQGVALMVRAVGTIRGEPRAGGEG